VSVKAAFFGVRLTNFFSRVRQDRRTNAFASAGRYFSEIYLTMRTVAKFFVLGEPIARSSSAIGWGGRALRSADPLLLYCFEVTEKAPLLPNDDNSKTPPSTWPKDLLSDQVSRRGEALLAGSHPAGILRRKRRSLPSPISSPLFVPPRLR